ncbi:MAG: HDIG domain-containing protein [bacterium]|jgi:putative nucleotidyltransferase with HDIG domain|nr:HDIG domain-containing protein [bacterium]
MSESANSSDKSSKGSLKGKRGRKEAVRKAVLEKYAQVQPHLYYYLTLLAAVAAIYFLIRPPAGEDISHFRLNEPAPRIVSAPFEFSFVDDASTTLKQLEAEARVAPVYRYKEENLVRAQAKVKALAQVAGAVEIHSVTPTEAWAQTVLAEAGIVLADRIYSASDAVVNLPHSTFSALAFYRKFETFWTVLGEALLKAKGDRVADNVNPLRFPLNKRGTEMNLPLTVGATLIMEDGQSMVSTTVYTMDEFVTRFQELIAAAFPSETEHKALREFALDLLHAVWVGPTLFFDVTATELRRNEASQKILPIVVQVNKGETIIGKNKIVTEEHILKLRKLQERMRLSPMVEMGYFILSVLFVVMLLRYFSGYYPTVAGNPQKVGVIFFAVIMVLALARVAVFLSMLDLGGDTLQQVGFMVPVGALGVMLTILDSALLAMFCCGLTALYVGIILSGGIETYVLPYVIVAAITSSGAIYAVTRIQQRSDLYRAGGVVILLSGLAITALALLHYKTLDQLQLHAQEIKWALIWGAVNGGLVTSLCSVLLPIFEDFYGVITDIKLLELSQKNELLQRLEEEAPGSYQHSMRVATLAETAAGAIKANALLTRVGCYYHDIGKMEKAQYFVENQQTSADKAKHSKISPHMSCLIIRNHVKNGIELAKKYKLPKAIVDFIPEHHGTTLMAYFYNMALSNKEMEGTIKEEDFRYPGPKPQSRETAIVMLADCLEAASRTLENATEGDIRQLVRKMINERFMDGQFDECDLSLKDLNTLCTTFSESLMHMKHQRIVYPERPAKEDSSGEAAGKEGEGSKKAGKEEKRAIERNGQSVV